MVKPARNRAVDVLRGWAIVVMIATHVGVKARVTTLINLPYWLDPAGPFVLLSGLVLGMGLSGTKPLGSVPARARKLWLIHVGLMSAVLLVHEATGRLNSPGIADAGGLGAVIWKLPTLRLQAADYMNILPLFIVFFAMAGSLVRAVRAWPRAGTACSLLLSFGVWLVTQRYPGWMRFTDPACGKDVFLLPAWQFPFVIGLMTGLHTRPRGTPAESALSEIWSRHGRSWLPALSLVAVFLFALAQLQRRVALPLGARLPPSAEWLFAKESWGPGRAAYTLSALGLGYLALDRWLQSSREPPGVRALETMGRRSLYCFLVHLPLALLASFVSLAQRPVFLSDLATLAALGIVYLMARHEILGRYIPS